MTRFVGIKSDNWGDSWDWKPIFEIQYLNIAKILQDALSGRFDLISYQYYAIIEEDDPVKLFANRECIKLYEKAIENLPVCCEDYVLAVAKAKKPSWNNTIDGQDENDAVFVEMYHHCQKCLSQLGESIEDYSKRLTEESEKKYYPWSDKSEQPKPQNNNDLNGKPMWRAGGSQISKPEVGSSPNVLSDECSGDLVSEAYLGESKQNGITVSDFENQLIKHEGWKDAFRYHVLKEYFRNRSRTFAKRARDILGISNSKGKVFDNMLTKDGHKAFRDFYNKYKDSAESKEIIAKNSEKK
ncbi:MAG: hypothetical protein JEZ07_15185 [Phycisphaerae bacterium]|nr:hypothetical protein [Phycisphaerae bacterium]